MALLCVSMVPGDALLAGARRKAVLGIPIASRLIERDQYEWLMCSPSRILPLLELHTSTQAHK